MEGWAHFLSQWHQYMIVHDKDEEMHPPCMNYEHCGANDGTWAVISFEGQQDAFLNCKSSRTWRKQKSQKSFLQYKK
jgi:hypothetical protein